MFGRCTTASANDTHAKLLDELAEHLRHRLGLERVDGVAGAGVERQPRIGDARHGSRGILCEIADRFPHVFRTGRAIEPNHIDTKRLERCHGARDVGAEQHSTARVERDLRLDRHASADLGEETLEAGDCCLHLEDVLRRLDEKDIHSAFDQVLGLRVVVLFELRERGLLPLRQVATVGVHVLSEQRDLAHAVVRQAPDLVHELRGRTAHLPAAGRGDDAVGAGAVAADRNLDPGLELALSPGRQVAGEPLELEEPLRAEAVAGEELGELGHLARPEGDVHEREALEDLVLERLGPAAADAHDPLGVLGLEPLRLAEVAEQPVVGRLTDRASVEEDHVRRRAVVRLPVAERLEHALHALRVVLVHLAPEGGDVVRLHGAVEG